MLSLFLAIAWGLGLAFSFSPLSAKLLILGLFIFMFIWKSLRSSKRELLHLILVFVFGCGIAWANEVRYNSQLQSIFQLQGDASVSMIAEGRVDSFPVVDGDRLQFFFAIKTITYEQKVVPVKERVWVNVHLTSIHEKEKAKSITRGDTLQLPLVISLPTPPTNPGAFDFPKYLWQQYVYFQAKVDGFDSITKISSQYGWTTVASIRSFLESKIDRLFQTDIAGLMKGMLLGNQKEVSVELEEIYRDTGIIHILAISGTHVMLVIGAAFVLLQSLRMTRERIYEILFLFLPLYMMVTGLSPSVVRASLMGMIFVAAQRYSLKYSAWHAISIVFMILTFMNPRVLFHIGFQLSFAVTLGLIMFTKPIAERIHTRFPWISENVANAIAITVIAQWFAFPLLVTSFYQFPILSIVINLLLIPLFGLLIPWGYLTLLISLFLPTLAVWIAYPLEGMFRLLHHLLGIIVEIPMFIVSFATLPVWWWIVYVLLLIPILLPQVAINKKWRKPRIIFLCLLLLIPLITELYDPTIRITFLDVGQGDSILIQGPRKQSILIDGGGQGFLVKKEDWQIRRDPYEVGKDVVVPSLRSLGINRINWLVITHGDSDHIGGLIEVVQQLHVDNVLVNGNASTTELEEELFQLIENKGIPVWVAKQGPWLKWKNDITWEILNPITDRIVQDDNNDSIVLALTAYGRKVIFTGDLEASGEANIIHKIRMFDVDILKVGHHGSKSSTTEPFLDAITPEIAVISVGAKNWYGHPHPDVIERLAQRDIKIFRTDLDGALTFKIKKNGDISLIRYK